MDLTPDPVLARIGQTVRARLAAAEPGNLLAELSDMDGLAYEAPIDAGGFDLGTSCGVMVCAELGRVALPDVYPGSLLVIDALTLSGDVARAAEVVDGKQPVVAAGLDVVSVGMRDSLVAQRDAGGWQLSGTVAIDDSGQQTADACVGVVACGEVVLVLLPAQVWQPRMSGGALVLDGLTVADTAVIGRLGEGSPLSDPANLLARTRLRHAGYLLGLGEGSHELAVAYAAGRRQFGRSIVDNQSIAFQLAQAKIALTAVRLTIQQAAWLADAEQPFALEAVQSLAYAAETALRVVRFAVQVHGARGLSLEYPVHAFYLAARDAVTRLGPVRPLWIEAGERRVKGAARC